jgi:hypothetical protein
MLLEIADVPDHRPLRGTKNRRIMYALVAVGALNIPVTVLLHSRGMWFVACLELLLALFMALDFGNSWIALAALSIILSLYCLAYMLKIKHPLAQSL